MPTVIEKLLVVQDIDIRIRDIEQRLQDIPRRQEQEQTRLADHKAALAAAEEKLKAARADVSRMELESESRKAKITKLRQQQFELKTNKEFKTMEAEIEAVEAEIRKIEDQELELMEQVEAARAGVAQKKADLDVEEQAVQADVRVLQERAGEIEQELARCRAEREIAVTDVAPDWLAHYERLMVRGRDRALVALEGGVCGGCHMKLPPSFHHATRRHDNEMVVCEYCSRLLYC
jgi:predicted  nucleic acid-binding Zn-ribbon protein